MKNRGLAIAALSVLSFSTVFSGTSLADSSSGGPSDSSPVENSHGQAHPHFTWGNPGPSSAVLHPGSARGAGMMQEPLHQIDEAVQTAIEERVMPGAVVLVARRGAVVKKEAYGYAARYTDDEFTEMDKPVKMEEDTIFDLASISKLFTTTAAMILYEQEEFDLDDPVAEYIPEFAQNGKSEVTIQQLMTHTSGFKAWIPLYTRGESREERFQMVFSQPLENEPGTSYTYSDLNMITLGAIVERISGKRLDEFVKENITEPLGMEDTMYNPPASLKHRIAATEYQPWTDRGLVRGEVHDENAWSLDGVAGHAGVFSTAQDLGIFAHMILQDGKYGGARILEPETVDLLVENQLSQFPDDAHGLGWELNQGWYMDALSEQGTMGHTGYTGTSIVVSGNNDTISILLTNRVHPTRNTVSTNGIRRKVARLTADAIAVDIPKKGKAWFSGYGSNLESSLKTEEVDLKEQAKLSFQTWYRAESGYDYGFVEISADGSNWEKAGESITGSSGHWVTRSLDIPADTKYIRFTYETDGSVNGRGWYVHHPQLTLTNEETIDLELSSEEWELRGW